MTNNIIFVFGSNLSGRHGKGAALHARNHYGAEYGIGEGRTGDSYALPTKDEKLASLPFLEVVDNIDTFFMYALENPELTFKFTPVGTGLAGQNKEELIEILKSVHIPDNVLLTGSWFNE